MFIQNLYTKLRGYAPALGLLLGLFLFIVLATATGVAAYDSLSGSSSGSEADTDTDTEYAGDDANCNVIGIEIRDCILTYRPDDEGDSESNSYCDVITSSEEVVAAIEDARDDDDIKAVLLEIDSGGGQPLAAEEIADSLKALGKPSIAWIRGSGNSAAYWIASAAGTIISGQNSDVGSIGVTQSYVDNAKQNQKDGLTYNQLSTGPYKDTGSTDKPLTAAERVYLERDLNLVLKNFIKTVATNRDLSLEKVTALADGSSMLGAMALENGLIDQLGTKKQVWDALQKTIGEEPEVCW